MAPDDPSPAAARPAPDGPDRTLWVDAGTDVRAIAALLESEAQKTQPFRFAPRPLPAGTDPSLLHQAAIVRIRDQLAARHGEADRIVAQEVAAVDDLVRAGNLLVERLREWYGLHAPEVPRLEPDAEKLAARIAEHGERAAVLEALDQAKAAGQSVGSDLDPADMAVLQAFAEALRGVHTAWRRIEERIRDAMTELAPNLAAITGPIVGARLIALAGGLERLATFPASTVQLLGAETAFFRHVKEGTKPPKHGILYQHPSVHQAPPWQRGAIARTLALHASRAARADALTGNDVKASLEASLEKELASIRARKAKAPKRPSPSRGPGASRGGPGKGSKWSGKGGGKTRGPPKGRTPHKGKKPRDRPTGPAPPPGRGGRS